MNGKIRGFSGYVAEGPPPYAPENGSNTGKQGAFQKQFCALLAPKTRTPRGNLPTIVLVTVLLPLCRGGGSAPPAMVRANFPQRAHPVQISTPISAAQRTCAATTNTA
ncbi:MAG: hypothetical protein RR764_00705 [Oscillospiraceae bacterium]